jgi:hypothetical protein
VYASYDLPSKTKTIAGAVIDEYVSLRAYLGEPKKVISGV